MFGNKLDKIQKLVEGGKEAALIKLAKDKDKTVKLAAIAALGKIGKDDSFNIMVPDMLIDDDPDVRIAAAPVSYTHLDVYKRQEWNHPAVPGYSPPGAGRIPSAFRPL